MCVRSVPRSSSSVGSHNGRRPDDRRSDQHDRLAVLDQLLAFVWIIGITNAFNLLDNMDGLAAGISALAQGSPVWRCSCRRTQSSHHEHRRVRRSHSGIPDLQLSACLDLHGRRGQSFPWRISRERLPVWHAGPQRSARPRGRLSDSCRPPRRAAQPGRAGPRAGGVGPDQVAERDDCGEPVAELVGDIRRGRVARRVAWQALGLGVLHARILRPGRASLPAHDPPARRCAP